MGKSRLGDDERCWRRSWCDCGLLIRLTYATSRVPMPNRKLIVEGSCISRSHASYMDCYNVIKVRCLVMPVGNGPENMLYIISRQCIKHASKGS